MSQSISKANCENLFHVLGGSGRSLFPKCLFHDLTRYEIEASDNLFQTILCKV
jgi:hypothetical protein